MPRLVAQLDEAAIYDSGDPHGFRHLLQRFPDQLAEAARLTAGIQPGIRAPRAVLIIGMGGSAVAGDLLHGLCHDRAPFPVAVLRGYAAPAWVDSDTLVVASSYSGNTEETLTAFEAALARGARGVAITCGGELGRLAERVGVPWARVPVGFPPRAALGYLLIPALILLEAAGVDLGGEVARAEASEALRALGTELVPEVPHPRNPAKELAGWLAGRTPVIYATETTGPVAYRWRTQLEENAKVLALSGVLPEMNHNALEAWAAAGPGDWAAVFLRDRAEDARLARRVALTRPIIEARGPTREVWARGDGRLARLLTLVLLGDWVSFYLALLRVVDPWAVDVLETFKQRLARSEGTERSEEP